jgi:hypothetical protein
MTPKQIEKIKEEYFRVRSLRTGIPTRFYELPAEVLAAYEVGQQEAAAREKLLKKRNKEPAERVQEYPGRLCPRLVRRSTGDFSLPDVDSAPDW